MVYVISSFHYQAHLLRTERFVNGLFANIPSDKVTYDSIEHIISHANL